jgi:hypothetical protein
MPTLELVAAFEERGKRRRLPAWSERRVHWPCSTDELKRHIRVAVANSPNMDGDFVAEGTYPGKKVQIRDVSEGQEPSRLEYGFEART